MILVLVPPVCPPPWRVIYGVVEECEAPRQDGRGVRESADGRLERVDQSGGAAGQVRSVAELPRICAMLIDHHDYRAGYGPRYPKDPPWRGMQLRHFR